MSEEKVRREFNARPVSFGGLNGIFDEKGSTFLALRKIQWCKSDAEPDESKAKYELRKWIVNENGEEQANKGFSFLTEEGPHELVKVMLHEGFGKTKDVINEIKVRSDFKDAVNHMYDNEECNDGDFFDMRTALLEDLDGEDDDE